MIQATIYHVREYGKNIYSADEKEKYYSDYFLKIKRHVNDKVEQELEEFKIEIEDKVEVNETRVFKFPRPRVGRIYQNSDSSQELQYEYDESEKIQKRRRNKFNDLFK